MLALAGWSDVALPRGTWEGHAGDRPLALIPSGGVTGVAVNEDHTVRAVLVGRLYNRRELRTALGARHGFSGRDDAEVLVHLYEDRGVQMPKALRGAFALALWDAHAQRLLLARDHLGLQPLYYAAEHGRLAVASALPPLLALPGLVSSWDPAALHAFLALGTVPPPATPYPAIRQLAPGELAVWEGGRLRTQRYWQLMFPERRLARADAPALVRTHLAEAVQLRQAGVVHGLLSSGGLGSTTLIALARDERRLPVHAYTAAADAHDEDARAARHAAERAGIAHVALTTPEEWSAALDAVLAVHGAPTGGPDLPIVAAAARRAREDVTVALAGVGGDEVFGGSAPSLAWSATERMRRLPGPLREAAELWAKLAPKRWTANAIGAASQVRFAPIELYGQATALFGPAEWEDLFTPDALAAVGDARPWAALAGLFADATAAGGEDPPDALHHVALTLGLPARAAIVADAAAVGLELRLPLADHRVAQLVASVPAANRASGRGRQLLLRAALAGAVPRPTLAQPHRVATPPPASWRTGPLRALIDAELSSERVGRQGVFRAERVRALCDEQLSGRRDRSAQLWALLLATRWLARPVGATVAPAACAAG